jgi:predicted RNase H-like HicB family nuclease
MGEIKIIVEKHSDGYVAYPSAMNGIVVGEGDSYEETVADMQSAIRFHIATFGLDVSESDSSLREVFVAETRCNQDDTLMVNAEF